MNGDIHIVSIENGIVKLCIPVDEDFVYARRELTNEDLERMYATIEIRPTLGSVIICNITGNLRHADLALALTSIKSYTTILGNIFNLKPGMMLPYSEKVQTAVDLLL